MTREEVKTVKRSAFDRLTLYCNECHPHTVACYQGPEDIKTIAALATELLDVKNAVDHLCKCVSIE